jgi:hypothetical protein
MRHILLLLIIIVNSSVYAQQPELTLEDGSPRDIAAPVLVKTGNDEGKFGLFTAEPTKQKLNSLEIIRAELQRQSMHEQSKASKDGVFLSTTKRFTPESLTFFIAIGGVTFNSMWIKSHGDPLAMERHILSLKDPIAHLSFYAFMQTQGFYMNFHTSKASFAAMDPATRSQMMRRLTYQGMAVGSLASSIVADLGTSAKMCVDKWLKGKSDDASLESCNQAWKQWTVRNKFTQYFPQIISMWAAQAATDLTESVLHKGFKKVTMTQFAKKVLNKDFLVKTAYKITGADVALTFIPGGGWAIKGIKILGKVTRFSMFVGIDHLLSNYTYRPINNIIKPMLFDFDAFTINRLWHEADLGNWDSAKIKNPKNLVKFEKEIENYTKQMQQWRDHLNQDAETDLAGWLEMTKKILNQIDYSYKYYRGFAGSLFETLSIGHQINNGDLAPSAASIISQYPFRTLPFYGVSTGAYKAIGAQIKDFYLLNPIELEKRQKEHVLNVANQFKQVKQVLQADELEKLNAILEKLLSGNNLKMSSGLNDLNIIIDTDELERSNPEGNGYSSYSSRFVDAMSILRKALGDPRPVVYPFAGYSQAFAANSTSILSAQAADFSKWSILQKYRFNKEADLAMLKIICGKQQARLYKKAIAGVNFLVPQFEPPTLLRPNKNREDFCSGIRTTNNLYSSKIGDKNLRDYILANLNYKAIGDFTKKENTNAFEKWWLKNAKAPMSADFKKFDQEYKKVVKVANDNFFDHRSFFKFFVDGLNQSRYLPKSLMATLKAESNLYMQILNRVMLENPGLPNKLNKPAVDSINNSLYEKTISKMIKKIPFIRMSDVDPLLTDYNYVENSRQNSEETKYNSFYQQPAPELIKLNDLLNVYYSYAKKEVNFESYINHSKKIDTAINDVLVKAGLKKVVLVAATDEAEDLSAPASASGTENSQKIYEDVAVANPTYKQRMTVAAVKGLRQVESEIRRFIRMRISLSQTLDLDTEEFMSDWNSSNPKTPVRSGSANPFGGQR